MFNPQPIKLDPLQLQQFIKSCLGWMRKRLIYFILLLVAGWGGVWAFHTITKPKYKATCSFVLEEKSPASGMAGIASQFGVDLGALSGGAGSFFSGENIGDIIKSSYVLKEVLLSAAPNTKSLLADLYLSSSGIKQERGWEGRLNNFQFSILPKQNGEQQLADTALLVIIKRIREKNLEVERLNKKGSIYSVSFTSADPLLATLMTERLVNVTAKLYVDIKTRNLTGNIIKMETKADSLRSLFGSKVSRVYSYQILDANEAYNLNRAAAEVIAGDKTVLYGLYAEVMKNLEISRLMLISQTPVIQMLDKPAQPLIDSRSTLLQKMGYATVIIFAGFLLLALFVPHSKS
jgi:hypothetical protein